MSAPTRGPVFISFASKDEQTADALVAALERGGLTCWIAHRDISTGAAYPEAITAAVQSCAAFLVLVSEASNASPHVLREAEMAFNAAKPILSVRLQSAMPSTNLQYFMSTTQWLDAGLTFDERDSSNIRSSLERILAGGFADAVKARDVRRPLWQWMAGAAALLAIAAGVVVWLSRVTSSPTPAPVAPLSDGGTPPPTGKPASPLPHANGGALPPAGSGGASGAPRTRVSSRDGQTYVFLPPGAFTMGCSQGDASCDSDEQPSHLVRFAKGFWIGRTEVTVAQYLKGLAGRGRSRSDVPSDLPVTDVTWREAKAYCVGIGARLPTEAEWEYAARAGVAARYYGRPADIAWYAENSDGRAHPVAMREANAFGLYDMLGNVHEWVLDRYFNKYDDAEEPGDIVEPIAPNASAVVRGGAWTSDASGLRLSSRLERYPDDGAPSVGFRCAQD
jgi:formylglycine-generating enzyme required for sulfatase activity